MLRANFDADRKVMTEALGMCYSPADAVIARVDDEKLVGGFVFSNFTGCNGSIWGHVIGFSPNWLNKKLLTAAFDYVFVQLDCRAVFARIKDDNESSLEFNRKLGYTRLYHMEEVYPDGRGQYVSRMLKHECRWTTKPKILMSATVH